MTPTDPAQPALSLPAAPAPDGPEAYLLDPEVIPDLEALIEEYETPKSSIYTVKQQRLLTEPFYSSWSGPADGDTFLVLANVAWFHGSLEPRWFPITFSFWM